MGGCLSQPKTQDTSRPKTLRPGLELEGGKLLVVKGLGQGSWAEVYLVERVSDGKLYALKRTLITELSEAERWIAVNEVRLMASLSHPNLVDYRQTFVEDGCLHVVMEMMPHGDLTAVIEQHQREGTHLAEDAIWGYTLQIALGLQYLHSSGIVHRDIKPANILIGKQGVLKIADLGVAGLLHMGNSKLQIGTPQYMSPEMHAGEQYSFAADVWSLGCLVHELATLHPLFNDRAEEVVAKKVMATTLPPAIPARYSPELQIVINRMLQRDPAARPSIEAILNSTQLQSRMNLMPAELETSLSQHNISLDCMEGLPMLPAIEIPDDLSLLNQRLPGPRYSIDNLDMAPLRSVTMQRKPAATGSLQRIASPVTVIDANLYTPNTSGGTSADGGTDLCSFSVIDAAIAAALAAEKEQQPAAAAVQGQQDGLPAAAEARGVEVVVGGAYI